MASVRPSRRTKEVAMETMSQVTSSLRRKNNSGDDEDMEPSSEISRHEEDSDFEEPVQMPAPSKPPKKRAAKKDDVTQLTVKKSRKTPVEKAGTSRGGKQASTVGTAAGTGSAEDDGSLFEAVKSGKTALQTLVDDWVDEYKQDRDSALLELIQFFVHCSGCRGRVTKQIYETMEHSEIIRKMTEEFDEENADYPLITPGPLWKKFRSNFCDFVMVLVTQCQYSIIYDQYMMDNLISLLTVLTDSQVRAFRHTSTLASMKLMTALVNVALNLSVNFDNTQRQYDAERQKTKNKQASDRLELLMNKRQELEENQEEIRNMLIYIFKGVFVHRYRDILADIRAICMQEIGLWMKKYPNMFLDDSYLKYVGWTLYDKQGSVRLDCLKCLCSLFDDEGSAQKMELFTSRFKDRIVEMTLDKEYDVAVQAVKLVCLILKYNENILKDKDCENVYELVYSSHRAVAQAAGEFLNQKLFDKKDEAAKSVKTKKGKKRSDNTPLIRDLVQFFIESELHEHGAYLVDSLWDINQMMKDWECMTDLLIEEPGRDEDAFDDRQEESLIELMVCCIKQAATGESPVGRGSSNRRPSIKENRQIQEDKVKLTEHFIVILPELLNKYNADAEKVTTLLQIPLYFDLEIYTTSRLEKHLQLLLTLLLNIVSKHTEPELLENCSKCFEVLCDEENSMANKASTGRQKLIDDLTKQLNDAYKDYFQEEEQPDRNEAFAMLAALKRIYAFYCCHDLSKWKLQETLFKIVKQGSTVPHIPWEIVCAAVEGANASILWDLKKLDQPIPPEPELNALKKYLDEFMADLNNLLLHENDKVNESAYMTICDLLIVFSKYMTTSQPAMQVLVIEPEVSLVRKLTDFLSSKVFVEDVDTDEADENIKIEELHTRRNLLASFAKLVVYNVIHIKNAVIMFMNYMKFYNDYGDIIKNTMSKAREINKILTAKSLTEALARSFAEMKVGNRIDRNSDRFNSLKELGRRFSLSFGLDNLKNRDAVAQIHKEGIHFSLQSVDNTALSNLAFLEILCEFTGKLMKQDKKTVVDYLDRHVHKGLISQNEDYQSLLTYRNSLIQGDIDQTSVASSRMTGRPRGTRAKRRPIETSVTAAAPASASTTVNETTDSTWLKSVATPGPGHPQMQSTAIKAKKRRTDDEPVSEAGSDADFQEQPSWMNQQSTGGVQTPQEPNFSRINTTEVQTPQEPNFSRINTTEGPNVSRIVEESSMEESEMAIDEFDSPSTDSAPPPPPPQPPREPAKSRLDPNAFDEEEEEQGPAISQSSDNDSDLPAAFS